MTLSSFCFLHRKLSPLSGMYSSSSAEKTGKPLFASEDDSTYSNAVGGGCYARILSRNYVLGNMTSTIRWNLLRCVIPRWGGGQRSLQCDNNSSKGLSIAHHHRPTFLHYSAYMKGTNWYRAGMMNALNPWSGA